MPVPGRKPKPDGQKRNRHPLTVDWRDVPDVPFEGGPDLPSRIPGGTHGFSAAAKRWWAIVRAMPHCVLWTDADWEFAQASAVVYEKFLADPIKGSTALFAREKQLGMTADFRRNLRIRYVDPQSSADVVDEDVAVMDDYRTRLARLDETGTT